MSQKEVSEETRRVVDAVTRCSQILDNLDLNDHAATIATLQVLAQRRIAAKQEEHEKLKNAAQSRLAV